MKTRKRLLSILLTLAMLHGMIPAMTVPARAIPASFVASVTDGGTTTNYATFAEALSNWTGGSTLKLLQDVTQTTTITVPDGAHTLDLNGHGLIMGPTRGFSVTGSAKLNVIDSNKTTVHKYKIASPQSNGAGLATVNDALTGTEGTDYRTFTGGYITGANHPGNGSQGGAFYVTQNGVLNMDGGTVIGNSAGGGGVIFLSSSSTTTEKSVIKNANLIGNGANNCGSVIQQEKGNMVFENCHVFYNYTSSTSSKNAFHLVEYDGSTLIKNCTLEKNYSGNGFTVLIWNWGNSGTADLTLDDTIIKENDRGLSVAPIAGSNLIIKGNTSITGNSITNLKLDSGRTLAIDGQLSAQAAIGVTMDTPGVFTNTASDKLSYNDMSKFTSDNPSYMVGKNAAGQLLLGAPCTVTYNANGGSGTAPVDSSSPYANGSAVNVLKNTLTRAGYTFAGWKIGTENTIYANSADNIAGAAESFTITENTTLTSQWTAIPATAPTISGVTGATLTYGYTSGSVSVTATAETGHIITGYQWYSNTTNSNTGGTSINGATSASYTIPTGKNADTTEYYYCVVTATRNDNSQTAPTTSGVATVKVDKAPAPATTTLTDKQKPDGKKDLEYTGQPQDLVTGPSELPKGYIKVQYSIDDGKTWTDEVPTGEDSGTYTVKVKYIGDDNHTDFDGDDIPVTIDQQAAPAPTTLTDQQKPNGKKDLEYTGQPQDLVTAPSELPDGYTKVQYSIDDGKTWTDEVPTGEDSGDYTVKVKYIGDDNHTDFDGDDIPVTIGQQAAPAATTLPNTQKPAAKKNLAHTGQPQELVTPPGEVPAGYAVQYSLDGTNWSTEIPKGTDVGNYTVKVKYVGDDNHTTFDGEDIPVTIALELTDAQKPKAKDNLTYTGEPQELVTAPTAALPEPYRIVYALGDANGATQPYTTSIPTATEAGTYYVWYKVVPDKNHIESTPTYVAAVIQKENVAPEVPKGELVYNGAEQALVKAGKAEGGTLMYALKTDGSTPADADYKKNRLSRKNKWLKKSSLWKKNRLS